MSTTPLTANHYESLIETMGGAILGFDDKGYVNYASESIQTILQIPPNTLIKSSFHGLFNIDLPYLQMGENTRLGAMILDSLWCDLVISRHREGYHVLLCNYESFQRRFSHNTLLDRLFKHVPITIYTVDRTLTITSAQGQRINDQLDPQDIVGRKVVRPDIENGIRRAFKGETVRKQVITEGRLYDDTMIPVYNSDGKLEEVCVIAVDITERRQQEEKGLRREYYYHLLAQELPNTAVFIFDHDKRFVLAEGTAFRAAGYTTDTVEGRTLREIFPQTLYEQLLPYYDAALEGQEIEKEERFARGNFMLKTMPLRDEDKIVGGMIIAQDISSIRRAETELERSEARNRALLRAIPDFMFVINREGNFTEFESDKDSLAAKLLLPEMITGLNIEYVTMPEYIKRNIYRSMEAALKSADGKITYEYNLVHGKEQLAYFESRFVRLNEDEVMVMVRDMTELHTTRHELEERIDQLNDLTDIDEMLAQRLNIEYVMTTALNRMLLVTESSAGFIALNDFNNNKDEWMIHEIGGYDKGKIRKQLNARKSVFARAMQLRLPTITDDLNTNPEFVRLLPDHNARVINALVFNDRVMGVLVVEMKDLTALPEPKSTLISLIMSRIATALENARLYAQTEKQLHELQTSNARVLKLEALKTDMIRIASHDLRAPLTVMINYGKMLESHLSEAQDSEGVEYARNILEASERMRRMTSDILSLERIEAAAEEAVFDTLDIIALVNDVFSDYRSSALLKSLTYEIAAPIGEILISADAVQIREAMANLITNAIKYTPDHGSVRVELNDEDECVVFMVTDSGFGIPENKQVKLFQPFYRVRSPQSGSIEGTGLGLSLVKNIVERHGGKILFTSIYGQGSTFGFTLPLHQ